MAITFFPSVGNLRNRGHRLKGKNQRGPKFKEDTDGSGYVAPSSTKGCGSGMYNNYV